MFAPALLGAGSVRTSLESTEKHHQRNLIPNFVIPVYMAQERRQTWIDAITYPSPVIPETRASQKMDALNM